MPFEELRFTCSNSPGYIFARAVARRINRMASNDKENEGLWQIKISEANKKGMFTPQEYADLQNVEVSSRKSLMDLY
jgi:hypothetical protein